MSKKYTRNYNSTYATFLRSYRKAVAEFAMQVTVNEAEQEEKPIKYRRGVRASLALGGIGAGYALGKNPEAQELIKTQATNLKENAIDKALDLRERFQGGYFS